MWEIRIEKKAKKDLNKIPEKYRQRILASLVQIANDPFVAKKLSGHLAGMYSLRVLPYRIIYKIYRQKILIIIIRIGYRRDVYK